MKKILLSLAILLFAPVLAMAQGSEQGDITGKVVERGSRAPIEGAQVTIMTSPEMTAVSAPDGSFLFEDVPYGVYRITVEALEFQFTELSVRVNTPSRDIDVVTMVPEVVQDIDDGSFVEFDFEGGDAQAAPVTLSSSRDVFDNIAGYKFSPMRFRSRGYDTGLQNVYMNGILLNDAMNGYSPWSLWSGLNEAARNQEAVGGLDVSDYGVGGINGVTNIDSRASALRQGFRSSVVHADAQYLMRFMATYSSGMLDNGWAFAASASLRYGPNLWVDGVYYNAWGYYLGVEKQFNPMHRLSFTFFGVPTKRGAQMAATDEAYGYSNNYYNPNWGWQEGKKRNARVRDYHEPVAILNYTFDISDDTRLTAAASFRFGKNGYSALDWYKGRDPKPDYYRNLPSYPMRRGETDKARLLDYYWQNDIDGIRQLDWDWMYDVNRGSLSQGETGPDGNVLPDGRSLYIVSDRRQDQRDFNINATLAHAFNLNHSINGGVDFRHNRTEYFTVVKDLLGGKYWVNVDNFADRDSAEGMVGNGGTTSESVMNDINNPDNFIVRQGDKYGYDYYGFTQTAHLWAVYNMNVGALEGFAAGQVGGSSIWRQGLYRKGLFRDNSFGDSEKSNFLTYTGKVGLTYNFSGQYQLSATGVAMANAPYFQDAFVSPRTRNSIVPNLVTEKVYGADLTYRMRTPWLTLRLSAYYTQINDQTKLISYYDDVQRAFTNFAMNGIDQRHMGVELGVRVPIYGGLSIGGALSWGDYIYNSDPDFTQTIDNSAEVRTQDKVLWDGLKVESTPQLAANIGLNYRTESYWFFGVDFNYYDNLYLSMNPLRRSQAFLMTVRDAELMVGSPEKARQAVDRMMEQEKFEPVFTLGANIGKSWYIQRKYNIGFSLEVKNILNNQAIRTGGFEQMRFASEQVASQENGDPVYRYTPFDSKYYYLYGLNYYLNIYFRF